MPIGGPVEALKYMNWLRNHPEHTDEEHTQALRQIIKERIEREKDMSLGQDRVRIKFNPSDNSDVAKVKQLSADLIDLCEKMRNSGSQDGEHQRLWALAMSYYENAAMWAVKAATF